MAETDLAKVERLYAKHEYVAAAKLILAQRYWRRSPTARKLIKYQDVLSNYEQIEHGELGDLLGQFINLARKENLMNQKVFIVHGWDHELKLEAKNYLQNTLGLECVILHEQDGAGDTIINKFEKFAEECGLAVALLSDQDSGQKERFDSPDALRRPRPNVLFELGYFFARLGRRNVLILKKGNVELHSDILGIEYIDVTNGIESAGEKIRRRISGLRVS